MSARWWLFGVWALVAASAVTWGLKLLPRPAAVPPGTPLAQAGEAPRGDWARVLGADAPPAAVAAAASAPAADPRFVLVGVVSPRQPGAAREGLALIAVDNKPARAYRVGAVVEGDRVLQSVGPRTAALGPRGGAVQVSLSLPALAEAARGVPAGMAPPPGTAPAAAGMPARGPTGFPGTAPAYAPPPMPAPPLPTNGVGDPGAPGGGFPQPGREQPPGTVRGLPVNPSAAAGMAAAHGGGGVDPQGAALR